MKKCLTVTLLLEKKQQNDIFPVFLIIFVHVSDCLLVPVCRDRNYDTIVWDGDCSRLKAHYAGFAEETTCVCRKKLRVNGVESKLTGTLYQATGKSPSCLYDYREIGNLKFFSWLNLKVCLEVFA